MEKAIWELNNDDLIKEAFMDTQYIMFAEGGAMGEAGAVYIVTAGGSIFHLNYVYGDIRLKKLYQTIPVLKNFSEGQYEENADICGFFFIYLGAGNNLFVREDAYEEFIQMTGTDKAPEELYAIWMDVAWKIIEKRNQGKLPFETKNKAEMQLLMKLMDREGVKKLSEEERIEEDMEAGYDPFEEERIYVTQELVHGEKIPDSLKVEEGFFTDGRSYLSEMWCYDLITNVTYYFPADDPLSGEILNDKKKIEDYLIRQKKLLANEEHPMEVMVLDTKEGKIYSVTVSVGCDDDYFCEAYM